MMDNAATPAPGTRRAALTLHALSRADQAWVLQQLSADQRDALTVLLAELETLGIPRDAALVEDALASVAAFVPSQPADLETASLCQVLIREPDQDFRHRWLSAMDASDQQAILAHWSQPLEPQPCVQAPDARWSPALREAIRQSWLEESRAVVR